MILKPHQDSKKYVFGRTPGSPGTELVTEPRWSKTKTRMDSGVHSKLAYGCQTLAFSSQTTLH